LIEGRQLSQLSALFHEGGQIVELINLATLPPAGLLLASVQAARRRARSSASAGRVLRRCGFS
jgi:hypothetical protein